MHCHPHRARVGAVLLMAALLLPGCTSDHAFTAPASSLAQYDVARSATSFTVGPLVITGIEYFFSGDRWHFRNAVLSGPVTGDLTGTAYVTLNSNQDMLVGSGPAWGTMRILTSTGDVWQATLTGSFVTGRPELAIQLFSQMVLHGPNESALKVECDETSATSETLVCTGTSLTPHT